MKNSPMTKKLQRMSHGSKFLEAVLAIDSTEEESQSNLEE